jgi:hypothetical protein
METALVVLGCDLINGGTALGPETIARCEHAFKRYQELVAEGSYAVLIMSPGMANTAHYSKQKDTMAIMMADWFSERALSYGALHCVFSPLTWGTRAEVRTALDYIFFRSQNTGIPFKTIEFVSSAYHMRRVRLVAERIIKQRQETKHKIIFRYLGVKYHSGKILREIRNLAGEFILGFFRPNWYQFSMTKWC